MTATRFFTKSRLRISSSLAADATIVGYGSTESDGGGQTTELHEAVTRVLVESRNTKTRERWFTVGVSPNIVDASFEALIDSINYQLVRAGATKAVDRRSGL